MKKKVAGREETQISKSIIDIHSIHHDIIQKRSPKRIRNKLFENEEKKTGLWSRCIAHIAKGIIRLIVKRAHRTIPTVYRTCTR
jgi:hypothetical protein